MGIFKKVLDSLRIDSNHRLPDVVMLDSEIYLADESETIYTGAHWQSLQYILSKYSWAHTGKEKVNKKIAVSIIIRIIYLSL